MYAPETPAVKTSISAPQASPGEVRSGSAVLLARVRSVPQLRLEPKSADVTSVVLHTKTIARIDEDRQIAEIGVAAERVHDVLANHDQVERGPLGVTVRLLSASGIQTAIALIRESRDQELYGWQASTSSP
jgi:hypothetical protein